jgi:hypothetical protein
VDAAPFPCEAASPGKHRTSPHGVAMHTLAACISSPCHTFKTVLQRSCKGRLLVDQNVRVRIERQALLRVTDVGCDLRHRDTLADLDADEPVAKIVRAVVGDAGCLAGVPHRIADRLTSRSGEHPAKRGAIVRRAGWELTTTSSRWWAEWLQSLIPRCVELVLAPA